MTKEDIEKEIRASGKKLTIVGGVLLGIFFFTDISFVVHS